jgi:type VI secretion system Hcp family effector
MRTTLLKFLAAASAAALVTVLSISYSVGTHHVSSASAAQSDYLLELDGVKDTIEVNSFQWGIISPRDQASGQSTGRRQYQPVIIRKRIDKASPLLAKAADNSTHYKKATLTIPSSDGTQTFTVTFQDVLISGFQEQSDAGSPPVETVSFTFQKIEMK